MTEGFVALQPNVVFDRVGMSSGMHVADLGCGRSGSLLFAASRYVGDGGIVYGVDVVPEVLEHLSGRIRAGGYDNIQVIWGDIEMVGKTAVPENSLDRCFIQNVLSSLTAEERALEEAIRLLSPGGKLVVIDWAKPLGMNGVIPTRLITADQVEQRARQLGFIPQERFWLGGYHYGLILSKISV
jgi:ubiquinone/menaquinone biosynthesis C-methylase UbiE